MSTSLYLDTTPPPVEKIAGEMKLSDTADSWPREVLQELLRQCPYLGAYEVTPELVKTDAEQGYSLGFFLVHNKSATAPLGPGSQAVMKAQGVRNIRIPIVIKTKKLQPLDVFLDSSNTPFPLSDERVRAALFRPQVFDSAKKPVGDVSLYEQLYPPSGQSDMSGGHGRVASVPQTKLGSARSEFLVAAIAPTISSDDLGRLKVAMERDPQLARALAHNQQTLPFMQFLGRVETTSAQDVEKVASHGTPPNVIQVERDGERYLLKLANSDAFAPDVTKMDRNTAAGIAGEDLVAAADATGAATVSLNPTVHVDSLEDEEIAPVTSFGEYRVKTKDGKEHLGWVFPDVVDFDGTALPFSLFTNGTTSAVQEKVVGSFVGKGTNIIRGAPKGYGFFYRVTASGGVIAFQPLEIKSKFSDEKGIGFLGETMMAEPVKIQFNAQLRAPAEAGQGRYALPADTRWAPLGKHVESGLISDAASFIKVSMVKAATEMVRIVSDRSTWSFSGPPLEKVAHRWREQLHGGDAMFVACALGMEPTFALSTLVKAAQLGETRVPGCRRISPPHEKLADARRQAKEMWDRLPKRRLLLKEAAALEDTTTIDKVLSLGFINPENVQTFISWLPDLEEALSKLAGLLLGARLDLQDVPEDATKSAMKHLDDVVTGLKKLMFRQAEA